MMKRREMTTECSSGVCEGDKCKGGFLLFFFLFLISVVIP